MAQVLATSVFAMPPLALPTHLAKVIPIGTAECWVRTVPQESDGVLLKGISMHLHQRVPFLLAAIAAGTLSLAGCAASTPAEGGGNATATPAQTATPSPDSSIVPAATSSPVPQGSEPFTFPDGRLSFQYPKGWRVEVFEASASPYVGTATVYDADGIDRINIYYGQIADVVAGTGNRTVLETDPVLGLRGHAVPTPHSSFFVDRSGGAAQYRMGLTAGLPVSPDGKVQDGLVMLDHHVLTADVLLTGQPFASDDAAKAWYWGAEGQALKAVLMSFSYR
jgi:hypothetical protein